MTRKIALKRLSSSDLTLFEHHYRNTTGAKQKGINLDSAVFIKSFFPVLPNKLNPIKNKAILTLTILGPGTSGAHVITRKVLKQQKNWRLNGELISKGIWLNRSKPIKYKKHGRLSMSFFRYGMDYLHRLLLDCLQNTSRFRQALGVLSCA